MYNSQDRVERRTKERKFTRVLSVFVLLAALLVSGYYVFSTTITDGAYKIYVGGKKYEDGKIEIPVGSDLVGTTSKGGRPFYEMNNKENKKPIGGSNGGSIFQEEITDERTEIVYQNGFKYIMSLASNDERSVQTNVYDNGQSAEANGDEFLATKFYIENKRKPNELTGDDGTIEYGIRIDVTANSKNALSAARFGIMKINDESKIYNIDEAKYDNSCFEMYVVAQPKMEVQENGDTLIYTGDEPNSNEYVSAIERGKYTNEEDVELFKNPNKGHEDEDWVCNNMRLNPKSNQWFYDSYEHDEISYKIKSEEIVPYVVCIWYEASDPNHNNDILGGYISFIVTYYEVE